MKIRQVIYAICRSGYFNKDLAAVKSHGRNNGSFVEGAPLTPGYTAIVQPGATLSVMLVLEDGSIGIGECADVIFSGVAGRDPLFIPADHMPLLESSVRDWLEGRDVGTFKDNADAFDRMETDGRRLHTAIRYGVTQALLAATAIANRKTPAEIVATEYGTAVSTTPIGLLASCHRGDALQLDRVIMKQAALLPHASFTVASDLGDDACVLTDYAKSIASRIQEMGAPDYKPKIHLDLYGTLGELFSGNLEKLADYISGLTNAVAPFELLLESPIIAPTQAEQINVLKRLKEMLRARGAHVGLIADEWCNTLEDIRLFTAAKACDFVQIKTPDLGGINNSIEAVIYCKSNGMGCCLGGTANETDLSARITAQIGLATGPDFMLSKPGIGADEGIMILANEMLRTLAILEQRQ
ncbi:methylaspartate ammonia-lyase [Pandoraea pulmonicola]|uniref:methylaspartate ammonia-lyase n=1 Tax=Pandoraea pulmonicola TaxID=93221 RepID=A0AAJ5CZG2_PANPU|nr:methylaspartate ammonia-lyase [Pandoraea pulmonicola]AJC21610.1 methylaspartate ammonia-lyase [Pandoraea pulmonicola]SUA89557.1 Methylaspartate ammonia-lyase [Pandoraea pulmonicola]